MSGDSKEKKRDNDKSIRGQSLGRNRKEYDVELELNLQTNNKKNILFCQIQHVILG